MGPRLGTDTDSRSYSGPFASGVSHLLLLCFTQAQSA